MPVSKQAEELFLRLLEKELAVARVARYEARKAVEEYEAQRIHFAHCVERCNYLEKMLEELETP